MVTAVGQLTHRHDHTYARGLAAAALCDSGRRRGLMSWILEASRRACPDWPVAAERRGTIALLTTDSVRTRELSGGLHTEDGMVVGKRKC